MSEFNAESLSALMDSEAEELEVRRLLRQVESDGEVRARWCRYHTARVVMQKGQSHYAHIDISAKVCEQIEKEAPHAAVAGVVEKLKPGRAAFNAKPLAGLAVAASVTAMVFFGVQTLNNADTSVPGSLASVGQSPVVNVGRQAAPATQSTLQAGSASVSASEKDAERLREQRMQIYMQLHAQHASVNIGQGMLPLARVASYEVE